MRRRTMLVRPAVLAFLLGAAAATRPALAADAAPVDSALVHVSGVVVDRAGKPIEYATVAVPSFKRGAAADEQGRFALDLPPGPCVLEVSQMGYEGAKVPIQVAEGLAPLRVALADQPVPLSEVTVAASSFGRTGRSEGAVVSRRDVLMTPGGAADIFVSLRALPGVNAPAEGAAVYVRGGPPEETLIRLDGNEIGHPYHYERASGGLFGSMDSYMLRSAYFSSGGFSAKYGGVLSGVLDIETQEPLNLRTLSLGLGMAGVGLSTSWALKPDKLSLVASARKSITSILFQLYGMSQQYETAPTSEDGAAKLIWRYSPNGRATISYLTAGDEARLVTNYLNFQGSYHERARNHFGALGFKDVLGGKVAVHGQLAGQLYHTGWTFGPVVSSADERTAQANVDAVWPLTPRHELSFGVNARAQRAGISRVTPDDSTDFSPGAPVRVLDIQAEVAEPGFYAEDKLRVWGPLYATIGGRLDYASTPGAWTADPRAALAWRVDEHQTLRVAAGRYHQLAPVRFLDPRYGNPDLGPLEAEHLIAGYEWRTRGLNVRLEGYSKLYHDLVTADSAAFWANGGHGYARGVDAFVQGTWGRSTGWLSYGYLDTRRRELDDPRELPARYDVRHTGTVVLEVAVDPRLQLGLRYGYNSGHPWTPVVGRFWDPARSIWHPIFGENQSAWFPGYRRLDARLTRLFRMPPMLGIPAGEISVFYIEGMNVLGLKNVLDYVYSSDYLHRYERESYFSRALLVAGVGLTW
jgi:hypothetical protein